MSRKLAVLAAAVAAVAVTSCAKPPTKAIDAAHAAQDAAVAAGAPTYAPDAQAAVASARAALDAEVAAQQSRMAFRRSYKQTEQLAADLKAASDKATADANGAKEQARQDATKLITDCQTALQEVSTMLASAPKGKGTAADLAALKVDLQSAGQSLTDAQTQLTSQNYLEARTKAMAASQAIDSVRAAVVRARTLKVRTTTKGH
jgi:hypothetical protein